MKALRRRYGRAKLPERTLDTMSEAIALSSPSGRMSKVAKKRAQKRLSTALFGEGGLAGPTVKQPTEKEHLLRKATELRDLASRGMRPRAFVKEAARLEALAAQLP